MTKTQSAHYDIIVDRIENYFLRKDASSKTTTSGKLFLSPLLTDREPEYGAARGELLWSHSRMDSRMEFRRKAPRKSRPEHSARGFSRWTREFTTKSEGDP